MDAGVMAAQANGPMRQSLGRVQLVGPSSGGVEGLNSTVSRLVVGVYFAAGLVAVKELDVSDWSSPDGPSRNDPVVGG